MIDIDALIKRMNETGQGETICLNHDECEALLILLEEREERIDIMSEGGWIPVEKRLPDEDDPRGCLVVVHYDDPYIGEGDTVYNGIVGYSADSGCWVTIEGIALFDEVTHWQYAPEPPKEGDPECSEEEDDSSGTEDI